MTNTNYPWRALKSGTGSLSSIACLAGLSLNCTMMNSSMHVVTQTTSWSGNHTIQNILIKKKCFLQFYNYRIGHNFMYNFLEIAGYLWKIVQEIRKSDNLKKVLKSAVSIINTVPGDYRKLIFY